MEYCNLIHNVLAHFSTLLLAGNTFVTVHLYPTIRTSKTQNLNDGPSSGHRKYPVLELVLLVEYRYIKVNN